MNDATNTMSSEKSKEQRDHQVDELLRLVKRLQSKDAKGNSGGLEYSHAVAVALYLMGIRGVL